VLEGGALDWDGEGTILTTRECLLNPEPQSADERDVTSRRCWATRSGRRATIWIDRGLLNDHTDGHVDNIARFLAPGVVACQSPSGADDPHAARLDEIAAQLENQRDARGRMLKVVRIPSPGRVENEDGDVVPASHMNFLIGNATVVVPTYGTPSAQQAVDALKPYFPGRNVVGLPSRHILSGGGSFHCITQQQPDSEEAIMARKITLAVLQSALTDDADKNIKRISDLVREAASKGADVILPSELFEGHYFCTSQEEEQLSLAPILARKSRREGDGETGRLNSMS
jgi:hypothetical protein